MYLKVTLLALIIALGMHTVLLQKLSERSKIEPQDFVYNLADAKPTSSGAGGVGRLMTVDTFPPLAGEGVSIAVFDIEPCGINLPHVHPRASEIFYVLKGTFEAGLAEENGGRTIINMIKPGEATFFPQGLLHYQVNHLLLS